MDKEISNKNKASEENNNAENKNGALNEILDWIESFIFAIFVVLLVFIFLFRTVVVDGDSMQPTLYDKQRLVLTHFNYTPDRGDIIVANCPGLNKTIIKRCIGVAGDVVIVDYGTNSVTVNGEKIDENYLGEEMRILPSFDITNRIDENRYEYHVPEDCILAFGDNRNNSRDSRDPSVGYISCDDVLGKAVCRFYPFDTFKKLN